MNKDLILIVGNGISGSTAAREIRKRCDRPILMISEECEYFFSRPALMYVYMGHLKWAHTQPYPDTFWKDNDIALKKTRVEAIDFEAQRISCSDGAYIEYTDLVLALGSVSNKLGWPGQDAEGVTGLYHKSDLEALERFTISARQAVIVGGGLIGIELAEMLLSRGIEVHFLVREASFWDRVLPQPESAIINDTIRRHGVHLHLLTGLQEIVTDCHRRAIGVITDKGEKIAAQIVGLTVGVSPHIAWLKATTLAISHGILIDEYLRTNLPHVYAIGDCAELKTPPLWRRPIEAVWYSGKIMGETVAHTLTGKPKKYLPGHWYNSAKFFDIEYQIYGQISVSIPNSEKQFFWSSTDNTKTLRIAYNDDDGRFIGVCSLGIRWRQEYFHRALHQQLSVEEVIAHLAEANFDPEFYHRYESDIFHRFRQKHTTL